MRTDFAYCIKNMNNNDVFLTGKPTRDVGIRYNGSLNSGELGLFPKSASITTLPQSKTM